MGLSKLVQETKQIEIRGILFTLKKWPERHRRWKELRAGELYTKSGEGRFKLIASPEDLQTGLEQDVLQGLQGWGLEEPLSPDSVKVLLDDHGDVAEQLIDEIEAFNRVDLKNSLPSRKP